MTPTEQQSKLNALGYAAPFLIDKLVKDQVVETAEEGEALFLEVKRFLVLIFSDATMWDMYSRRVDEIWHQFILFTSEYTDFCLRFFGGYIHHSPGVSPKEIQEEKEASRDAALTFHGFKARYQEFFGLPLPDVWWDATSVTSLRRVLNDNAGRMSVRTGDPGMVDLLDADDAVLLSVSDIARDSLTFISETRGFYVRELPGGLTDEEKIGLVSALVRNQTLRVAF